MAFSLSSSPVCLSFFRYDNNDDNDNDDNDNDDNDDNDNDDNYNDDNYNDDDDTGCHCNAILRYAFLMSFSFAFLFTPRTA